MLNAFYEILNIKQFQYCARNIENKCIAINYRLYIPTMNNDDYRKTFCRLRHQQDITPHKKKTNCIVKLPSVKQNQLQSGNYVLGNIIGEGGFAKVRMCTLKKGGDQFVMKIFEKFRLNTDEKKKGVMRQIQIMKCLKHPSIIKIVDYFQTAQTINIIMEYFSLNSLATYAKAHRPIADSSLRSIVRQIAQAMSYLHGLKIAHRDIKPENILVNQKQEIKVIDLGLSMMGEHIQVKVAGTPFYMSPQLVSKRQYDPFKADIWAFGILLYWLSLGYFPQDNESSKKKKNAKTFQLHFPANMHPGIQYLISKMLQQEPNERLSVEQILNDTWVKPKDFKNQISKLMKKLSSSLEGQ